ncbi:protein dachsous-like [Mya arenaria]|nr:protein dachsous-like [Mya arenaria]
MAEPREVDSEVIINTQRETDGIDEYASLDSVSEAGSTDHITLDDLQGEALLIKETETVKARTITPWEQKKLDWSKGNFHVNGYERCNTYTQFKGEKSDATNRVEQKQMTSSFNGCEITDGTMDESNNTRILLTSPLALNLTECKVGGIENYPNRLFEITQGLPGSATAEIKVTVDDVDDQNPVFTSVTYRLDVAENNASAINVSLETIPPLHAYDPDFGINSTIKYSIKKSPDLFSIDESTAEIHISKLLDYEQTSEYTVTIEAYQEDRPSTRTAQTTLNIYVIDVDDNGPYFKPNVVNVTVLENQLNGTRLHEVKALDIDTEEKGYIFYTLAGDGPFELKTIDNRTAVLEVNGKLDRETKSSFVLTVIPRSVLNEVGKNKLTVNIEVADINDNSPVFIQGLYHFNINNTISLSKGMTIGEVTAEDKDTGDNADIIYTILKNAVNVHDCQQFTLPFDLDSTTGKFVMTVSDLHCEYYSLIVEACDNPVPSFPARRCETTSVDIKRFVADGIRKYVKTFDVKENDPCNGQGLIYDIIPEKARLAFNISDNGDMLLTAAVLDRENISSYALIIDVKQGGDLKCVYNISVNVIDVNDNPPLFTSEKNVFYITPSTADGSKIGTVKAEDHDTEENARINYFLTDNGASLFHIDNHTGDIYVDSPSSLADITKLYFTAMDMGTPSLRSTALAYVAHGDDGFVSIKTPLTVEQLTQQHSYFEHQLSRILGLPVNVNNIIELQNDKLHKSQMKLSPKDESIDNFLFISYVYNHFEEIRSLMYTTELLGGTNFGAPEIGLIVMAVVILIETAVIIHRLFGKKLTQVSPSFEVQEISTELTEDEHNEEMDPDNNQTTSSRYNEEQVE